MTKRQAMIKVLDLLISQAMNMPDIRHSEEMKWASERIMVELRMSRDKLKGEEQRDALEDDTCKLSFGCRGR